MMKYLLILCFIPCAHLLADAAEYKGAIARLSSQIQEAPLIKKSDLALQLAEVYVADQNLEMAFTTYLDALDWAEKLPASSVTQEEQNLYEAGLKTYLEHSGGATPRDIAETLGTTYGPIVAQHPDYYLLNFLVAASYANLGLYPDFFQSFFRSYQRAPDHYMAYKTRAVLHIKLFERVRTPGEREKQREAIVINVEKAMERNRKDPGLYKLRMLFASEKEKPHVVAQYLNKILEDPMIIARADVAFFVQQAVAVNERDLAQQFIDKAREKFDYSRVIMAAQQYLDKHRSQESEVRSQEIP